MRRIGQFEAIFTRPESLAAVHHRFQLGGHVIEKDGRRQHHDFGLAQQGVYFPQNIILDEPSNGLDVMATRSLRDLILKLKHAGRCVLFSSHVMQEVAALCDDICIIANGKVAIDDSADGIRTRTGCDDLEDAFVRAIQMVDPA